MLNLSRCGTYRGTLEQNDRAKNRKNEPGENKNRTAPGRKNAGAGTWKYSESTERRRPGRRENGGPA
ncbi:hypothetical protein ACWGCP_06165, partial [Streptomyces niveus]